MAIFIILAIIVSVFGLIITTTSRDSFSKATCSAAMLIDDVKNGNTTNDGSSYFMGMNQVPVLLEQLRTNLTNIDNNLTEIYSTTPTTTLNTAISQTQTAITDTILISNNDNTGTPLTLDYNTPLENAITSLTTPSTFPVILGSTSGQNGLVGTLHANLVAFRVLLSTLQTNAQSVNTNLATINSGMATAVTNSTTLKDSVISGLGSVDNSIIDYNNGNKGYEIGFPIYWVCLIVFSVLCLMAALCAYSRRSECCRWCMYFFCFWIFILTFIGFLLSTVYSIVLPVSVWGCEYYDQTISSQASFQANLNNAFNIQTLQQMGVCMPFGNGNIYEQFAGTTDYTRLTEMQGVFDTLSTFNLSNSFTPVNTAMSNLLA